MKNDNKDKPILLLGGTGHYGKYIVRSLILKGQPVRIQSRNADNARAVLGKEVEIIQGDITSKESAAEAVNRAEGIIVSISAFNPRLIRSMKYIELDSVLAALEEAQKQASSESFISRSMTSEKSCSRN